MAVRWSTLNFGFGLICAGDSASIEEELRQKVLLGVANILLTYANDKVPSREPRRAQQVDFFLIPVVCVYMCVCVCVCRVVSCVSWRVWRVSPPTWIDV